MKREILSMKNNEKLYIISLLGCDDSTHMLKIMEPLSEELRILKEWTERSASTVTYGCEPEMQIVEILNPLEVIEQWEEDEKEKVEYRDEPFTFEQWINKKFWSITSGFIVISPLTSTPAYIEEQKRKKMIEF